MRTTSGPNQNRNAATSRQKASVGIRERWYERARPPLSLSYALVIAGKVTRLEMRDTTSATAPASSDAIANWPMVCEPSSQARMSLSRLAARKVSADETMIQLLMLQTSLATGHDMNTRFGTPRGSKWLAMTFTAPLTMAPT